MTLQEMPSPSLYVLGPPGNAAYSQNYKYELKGWIQRTITKDWVFWCWVRVAIVRARVHGSQWGDGGQREEGKSCGNGSYWLNSKLIYLFFRGIPSFFKIAIIFLFIEKKYIYILNIKIYWKYYLDILVQCIVKINRYKIQYFNLKY